MQEIAQYLSRIDVLNLPGGSPLWETGGLRFKKDEPMSNRQLTLLASVFLFSTACATKVDGLYVSDSFKPDTLKRATLITGGVANITSSYNRDESNSYSALMLGQFKDEREDLNLKPVETLIQALGDKHYNETIEKYAKSGLDAQMLETMAAKVPGIRFVAFAKIESNNTEKNASHQPASETKDDKGKVTKNPESWTKIHKRTVLASLHIYDLNKKEVAFSGQVTKFKESSRTYTVNAIGNVLSVVNAIKGKDDEATYPTPEAPQTREVLAEVFEGFAENFPKD